MKKKIKRLRDINLILRAIDLPLLVVEINEKGRKWTPKDYPQLKILLEIERENLINDLEVSID